MAEYIDRNQLIQRIKQEPTDGMFTEEILTAIDEIKTADVAEVRHGKWDKNCNCSVCGVYKFEGLDADIWANWDINYCPHCGAKMDLE